MPLFHPRIIEKHTKAPKALPLAHAAILDAWAESLTKGTFNRETSHDSEFIQRILIDVLGYTGSSAGASWTVAKNQPVGSGNVDAALGHFTADKVQIVAPFELKGAKTRDLDAIMPGRNKSPVQQAWEYAMDAKGAKWVLVSNYREIRLYAIGYGRKDYEKFDLSQLTDPANYARFILLLSSESLLGNRTSAILKESETKDKEITDALYKDYKELRALMVNTLTKENPTVPVLDIIQYTQTILDRILFVAFAEDRELLPKNTLESCYEDRGKWNPQPAWDNFKGLFHSIDKGNPPLKIPGYNGGLFATNEALNGLIVSDAICEGFKTIGGYDFESDVSVNILGHIFEQSITDLEEIKASVSGGDAEFDKKKSKRKKDGIFYTPPYITRYIVEQAVGGWLNDRKQEIGFEKLPVLAEEDYASIQQVTRGARKGTVIYNAKIEKHVKAWEAYKTALSNIKVLDPACGSGAFLNEVFDYLFREGQIVNSELTTLNGGQEQLFRWDTHILANNIYGVDINQESVEITKLSLWLKTANRNEKLTYLDDNIKCGNSLIDDPTIAGKLAFEWEKEFPTIMKANGFDVVIGNPPYGAGFAENEKEYFRNSYSEIHMRTPESFNYFIYKTKFLSRAYVGFIIPSSYLLQHEFSKSRESVIKSNNIKKVINLGDGVFEDVATPTCIVLWKKKSNDKDGAGFYADYRHTSRNSLNKQLFEENGLVAFSALSADSQYALTVSPFKKIIDKCMKNKKLKEVAEDVATGISSGSDEAFVHDAKKITEFHLESQLLKKLIIGGEINRYSLEPNSGKYILYVTANVDMNTFPNAKKLLDGYAHKLFNRKEAAAGYQLNRPRREKLFNRPKILVRQTANRIMASYDPDGWYCLKSGILIQLPDDSKLSYHYLLSVLNSKLINFIYQDLVGEEARIFPEVKPVQLFKLPVKVASEKNQGPLKEKASMIQLKNKELHDVSLKFLALLKSEFGLEKPGSKIEQWYLLDFAELVSELAKKKIILTLSQKAEWMEHFEKQKIVAMGLKAAIDATDREIDQMVYALYGLTADEIATVEGVA